MQIWLFIVFVDHNQGQCASLRVTDCSQLLREWSKEIILRDDVCTAQCGFLLRNDGFSAPPPPQHQQTARTSSLNTDLIPPPARHVRTRQLARPPSSPPNTRIPNTSFNNFNGFKFPDLSVFVAKWMLKQTYANVVV